MYRVHIDEFNLGLYLTISTEKKNQVIGTHDITGLDKNVHMFVKSSKSKVYIEMSS